MPGYWEIKAANKVLVGILHTDVTTLAWAFGLRNLIIPGRISPVAGMPFDHARNVLCQQALQSGTDYIFFLDSDVVPPRDAILRLIARNVPIISGVYFRRSPPQGVPVMIREGQWVLQYPKNQIIEVDVVGAGCLLIKREVLEKLPPQDPVRGKHWFDWRVDMQHSLPKGEAMSEDFTFCLQARKTLGLKILVDTSVECRHIGYGEARYGTFTPLECVPYT